MPNPNNPVAYFSMEIALDNAIPTYCGGLGILAGDTIKAAADHGLPMVAVTLLYRKGFFTQSLDRTGRQKEHASQWEPEKILEEMPQRITVPIEGRDVMVRAFRRIVRGHDGKYVPVYFLDTDLPENKPKDRVITHMLYQGDDDLRLKKRAILGIGGPRMLRALTHDIKTYHLNEGHGFMLLMELMSMYLSRHDQSHIDGACVAFAKNQTVFTTHTPIPAGHDTFPIQKVRDIVGDHPVLHRPDIFSTGKTGRTLNASIFCLNLTRYANGVAKRHGEVSREMFPNHTIDSITNGMHAATWTGPHMRKLFDKFCPGWRADNSDLRLAVNIPDKSLLRAHEHAKRDMIDFVNKRAGSKLSPDPFTIVFARRATPYKRPDLIISDLNRLAAIADNAGAFQFIFTGKAHPGDGKGKDGIQKILNAGKTLKGKVPITYVPDYDMDLGAHLVAGCDLWLNNPEPPKEASGTSGMKASLNGNPNLSSLDGWWIEGYAESITGWAIEGEGHGAPLVHKHAKSAYDKLENDILPTYYNDKDYWCEIMRSCIALNGSFFTTDRMVKDYIHKAYLD